MKAIATFAAVVGLALSLTLPPASAKSDSSKKLYPVTYNVSDLPVWRANLTSKEFAPQVLIKYLQTSIDPQSWTNGAEIKADEKHISLIISQNDANHVAIGRVMRSFRAVDPREAEEKR